MSSIRMALVLVLVAVTLYWVREGSTSSYVVASEESPLARAARAGELDIVEQLLSSGADVNYQDTLMRRTALHWAVAMESDQAFPDGKEGWRRRVAIVQLLLRKGADVRRASGSTTSPLDDAVWNPDFVEALLAGGAPVEGGAQGRTALTSAAYYSAGPMCGRAADSMRLLLKAGANVNVQEPGSKWTPLLTAVTYGCPEMVQVLLGAGANPNLKTQLGETVLGAMKRFEKIEAEHTSWLVRPNLEGRALSVAMIRKAGGL